MTQEMFFDRLRHHVAENAGKAAHKWRINDLQELRTMCLECPVTYVAAMEEKGDYEPGDYDDAADALGLDTVDASSIVLAADKFGEYDENLRQQLKAACGISTGG